MARTMDNTVKAEAFPQQSSLSPLARIFWIAVGAVPAVSWWLVAVMARAVYPGNPNRQRAAKEAAGKGLYASFAVLIAVAAIVALTLRHEGHVVAKSSGFNHSLPTYVQPTQPAASAPAQTAAPTVDSNGYPIWNGIQVTKIPMTADPYWVTLFRETNLCNQAAGVQVPLDNPEGIYSASLNGQSVPFDVQSWPSAGDLEMVVMAPVNDVYHVFKMSATVAQNQQWLTPTLNACQML